MTRIDDTLPPKGASPEGVSPKGASPGDVSSEGLIPEVPLGRRTAACVTAFFLACILLTSAIDFAFPIKKPRLIGREKVADQRLREEAQWLDGSRARLYEHDQRITSRVRRELGSYYGLGLYLLLQETSGQVILGHEGRIFLQGRTEVPQRTEEIALGLNGAWMRALDRRLARLGVQLVVVPIPRKSALYAADLPDTFDPQSHLDEKIVPEFLKRGIVTADLWTAYRDHLRISEEPLYFRADSHWTETAQLLAAEEACRVGGFGVEPGQRASQLQSSPMNPERDTLGLIGLDAAIDRHPGLLGTEKVTALDVVRGGEIVEHRNPSKPGMIALVGTSFSAERKLPALLSHCSQSMIWNAAKAGEHPLGTLHDFLPRARRERSTQHLVLEIPGHNLFGHRPLEEIEEIFAQNPPYGKSWALPVPFEFDKAALGKPASGKTTSGNSVELPAALRLNSLKKVQSIGWIAAGQIAHSGDGIVELRLTGHAVGDVEIVVTSGDLIWSASWLKSRRRVTLPWIRPKSSTGDLFIGLRGKGTVDLENIEVTAAMAGSLGVAKVGRLKSQDDGWRQTAHFIDQPVIPAQGGLVIKLNAEGTFGGTVGLQIVTQEKGTIRQEFQDLDRRALIVVDLDPYEGEKLLAVRLMGAGEMPKNLIRRATLGGDL